VVAHSCGKIDEWTINASAVWRRTRPWHGASTKGCPRNGESADTFICECVRVDCGGVLDLSIGEYARVRSHPRRFVVFPGHEEAAIESTVEVYPSYVVVEKHGEAGRVAETDSIG
jgi:hypothetical protein